MPDGDRLEVAHQPLDARAVLVGVEVGPPLHRRDAGADHLVEAAAVDLADVAGVEAGGEVALAQQAGADETGVADERVLSGHA